MDTPTGPIHDELYYFEDGSYVIQVENYLFNLHRSTLRRHSSFFRNMFSLPQSNTAEAEDGGSDDHPILCDDSVEAFRDWCQVLYAGLNELSQGTTQREIFDEKGFAHVGSLAHKYECDKIEEWARRMLDSKLCPRGPRSPNDRGGGLRHPEPQLPNETVEYLVRVSMECGWTSTLKTCENVLLKTIHSPGSDAHIGFGDTNSAGQLSKVLSFADSVGNVQLKARAHYAFLCSVEWSLSPTVRGNPIDLFPFNQESLCQIWWDPLDPLTDAQKICLYRGFHGLSSLRDLLPSMPIIGSDCDCQSSRNLRSEWDRVGKSLAGNRAFDGPKEFLEEMRTKVMSDYNLACPRRQKCGVEKARKSVDKFLERFDAGLVEFFSDHVLPRPVSPRTPNVASYDHHLSLMLCSSS